MPIVELTIDSAGAVKGINQFEQATRKGGESLDDLNDNAQKTSTSFDRLRKSSNDFIKVWGSRALVAGAAGLLALGTAAISAASDMEETHDKFITVFKDMEDQADQWATELNEDFLLSREESERFLSGMQDLLKPMGMASDAAGEMSFSIVKLSADLGAMNNKETAQVYEDIQSALVGSYETMKKYGVVINANVVSAEALRMGLAGTKAELTAAHKAQAAYNLILASTTVAHGNTAQTAGTFAGQMRLLNKEWKDLLVLIGEGGLPQMTAIITEFNKWAWEADGVATSMELIGSVLGWIHRGFQGIVTVGQGFFKLMTMGFEGLFQKTNRFLEGLEWIGDAMVKLGVVSKNPLDGIRKSFDSVHDSMKMMDEVASEVLSTQVAKLVQLKEAYHGAAEAAAGPGGLAPAVEEVSTKVVQMTTYVKNSAGVWVARMGDATEAVKNLAYGVYDLGEEIDKVKEKPIDPDVTVNGQPAVPELNKIKNAVNSVTNSVKTLDSTSANINIGGGGGGGGAGGAGTGPVDKNGKPIDPLNSQGGSANTGTGYGGKTSSRITVDVSMMSSAGQEAYHKEVIAHMKDQTYIFGVIGSSVRAMDRKIGGTRTLNPSPGTPQDWWDKWGGLYDDDKDTHLGSGMGRHFRRDSGSINLNINDKMSRSDIINIIEELKRNEARQ